jgi:hypothetical protein
MSERRDAMFWLLAFMAVTNAANAGWMLLDPAQWYTDLPAAVPDTGPFNPHFVRDIGVAFAMTALAFGWAAWEPRWRPPLVAIGTVFVAGHALVHVFDTVRGALDGDHWLIDLPVYLPALVLVPISLRLLRRAQAHTPPQSRPQEPI